MVLELHQSVLDYVNRGTTEERVGRLAIENLLNGYREGNHVVICPPILATNIRKRLFANSTTQAWLLRCLVEEWAIISSHSSRISTFVSILGDQLVPTASRSGHATAVSMPISLFTKSSLMQPTILLTENLDDSDMLRMMGRVFAVNNKLGQILKYDSLGGGGSTIADQFELIQSKQERFCLCVVDSDKRSPHDRLGDTARRVKDVHRADRPIVTVLYTPCHEIENTVPESIISNSCQNCHAQIQELKCFRDHGASGSFEHLDFKSGIYLCDFFTFPKTSPSGIFWTSSISKTIASPYALPQVNEVCLQDWACHDPSSCKCKVFTAFGNSLLSNVNKFFETSSAHNISRMLDVHCRPLWNDIGRNVFEWGCGWRTKVT